MASKIWRSAIQAAALVVGLVVGPASQAAVFYQSTFDPLDFVVKVIYQVDDGCLANSGLVWANDLNPTCAVGLYSVVATLLDDSENQDYVTFVPPGATSMYPSIIKAIYVSEDDSGNMQLGGVAMSYTTFLGSATSRDNYDSATEFSSQDDLNGTFWIRFNTLDFATQIIADAISNQYSNEVWWPWAPFEFTPPFRASARLYQRVCDADRDHCHRERVEGEDGIAPLVIGDLADPLSGYSPIVGPFRVAENGDAIPIPAPGSLALLVGALGAGWLSRRRKVVA